MVPHPFVVVLNIFAEQRKQIVAMRSRKDLGELFQRKRTELFEAGLDRGVRSLFRV